ncbi:hypothetical protein CRUP_020995, partial [Coryphaenoides rupestris]
MHVQIREPVLVTLYWLGRAAEGCVWYSGPNLDPTPFTGLLDQRTKCCAFLEHTVHLCTSVAGHTPPVDPADLGAGRPLKTPVTLGHGSDSESDTPTRRKVPDVHKDDMLARRTSVSEPRAAVPFNQYLPHRSAQGGYAPPPLPRPRRQEEGPRASWSTASSPVGGDRPLRRKVPDVHKDDMLARRTSVSEPRAAVPFNQYLPHRSAQGGYAPPPLPRPRRQEEGPRASWSTASSPVGGDRPLSAVRSCSEEYFLRPPPRASSTAPTSPTDRKSPSERSGEEEEEEEEEEAALLRTRAAFSLAGKPERGERRSLRAPTPSPRARASPSPPNSLPVPDAAVPVAMATGGAETTGASATSVSMIDMRADEEGRDPHCQARHQGIHSQYLRMRDDEHHWQDDLARWKTRRRSVSQDLMRKEEERKRMEQLMSGGGTSSQRRKSIKTYREIVEDKERREEELRLAYRSARSPEEAAVVLQRYTHRFSISEAVMERLQLPKLLDHSTSSTSSTSSSSPASPGQDPAPYDPDGPMRFLRQQSAPPP